MTITTEPSKAATAADVRAWAKEGGRNVADRGRISREIKDAFTAATGRTVE